MHVISLHQTQAKIFPTQLQAFRYMYVPQLKKLSTATLQTNHTKRNGAAACLSSGPSRRTRSLHPAVELRERDLQRHLDWVKPQGAVQPLLHRLEHERERNDIRHVKLLLRGDRLRVVLPRRRFANLM